MVKKISSRIPKRPIWTGTVSMGLVNIPVKLYTMTFDKGFSFRFLHKQDGQPLKYQRVCTKDDKIIPWEDTVKGYEISKDKFLVFTREELRSAEPESSHKIRINKFVDYLTIDPIYFQRSYILTPDKNDDSYCLLLSALNDMHKAGAGRITLRTKEYPVVIYPYEGAMVLTTLRYAYEIANPHTLEELKDLKEPKSDELALAKKIVADLSGRFSIEDYEDEYSEKVQQMIQKKLKGEKITAEKPPKEEARELMVALKETLEQLKTK